MVVPGPDACLKLLGGGAPSHPHEPPVLQGQPGPALHWLIACAHTGIVVGREIREGGWTPVHQQAVRFMVCCCPATQVWPIQCEMSTMRLVDSTLKVWIHGALKTEASFRCALSCCRRSLLVIPNKLWWLLQLAEVVL